MYWAYTTMTTVGYGDIYGTTIAEKVITCCWNVGSECRRTRWRFVLAHDDNVVGRYLFLVARTARVNAFVWAPAQPSLRPLGPCPIHTHTVPAASPRLQVWCMVTMVIGGFFLSFCFGRMASVISRLDADKVARGEQLHQLSAFMKDVELPRPLARK